MRENMITNSRKEGSLTKADSAMTMYGPWNDVSILHNQAKISVGRAANPPFIHPFFKTESCSSTMDLAWILHDHGVFSEWSSVLAERQHSGRGQFGRTWVSEPGNLCASLRLPREPLAAISLTPLVLAQAIQNVLRDAGLASQFKWPNDILVSRKKVGGIIVEEREGVLIAGIGLNVCAAPATQMLRDPRALPAAHLNAFGFNPKLLELWTAIIQAVMDSYRSFLQDRGSGKFMNDLENSMACLGERVVFKPHGSEEFAASIAGLTETGGLRLITADGEKTFHSGGFFPVVY